MSAVTLRRARSTDAGQVGAILSAFIDDTCWMPRIHTRAEDLSFAGFMIEKGWVTVAQSDDAIVGFGARNGGSVHALYVTPEWQGQGVGTELLNAMKVQTGTLGLWTFQANTGAQRFYLREGFVEAERTNGAGNDEKLPDIRYVWAKGDV